VEDEFCRLVDGERENKEQTKQNKIMNVTGDPRHGEYTP
jgi:hypothetical protein